ncbi:hypothetical protein MTR67_025703 [Solanum verrucosum]|uniref:Uncharacterized protein n=1 Tax=Solanum verrucosum TaxID=315347 RepID=A0AAF0TZH1_SOLVR|nr:hypothetical protein MTR67_025703 [Solanum verrucosum]
MESRDLQILDFGEIEVDPTLLNSVVVAITKNKDGYESGDDDIEVQQILFYSAQFHLGKKINKDIHEMISMKHPASDCNGILDIDSIMPVNFLMRHHYRGYHDKLEEDEEEEEEDDDAEGE